MGKVPVDVDQMKIDLMSISGHKIYGPKGIGALYVRKRPRVRVEAIQSGGGQEVIVLLKQRNNKLQISWVGGLKIVYLEKKLSMYKFRQKLYSLTFYYKEVFFMVLN